MPMTRMKPVIGILLFQTFTHVNPIFPKLRLGI